MEFAALLVAGVVGYLIGVVITVLVWSMMVASTLVSAHNEGKIVFLEEDALKGYLLVVGVRKEMLTIDILHKDRKLAMYNISSESFDFLKDWDKYR